MQGPKESLIISTFLRIRDRVFPSGSRRRGVVNLATEALRVLKNEGLVSFISRIIRKFSKQHNMPVTPTQPDLSQTHEVKVVKIDDIQVNPLPQPHSVSVDIIVYVHDALDAIQSCLESILKHTTPPVAIILANDGSNLETRNYLAYFANTHGFVLLHNDSPKGYIDAVNRGLQESTGEFVILLNDHAVVSQGWVDGMIACINSDPQIGIVNPLSNVTYDELRSVDSEPHTSKMDMLLLSELVTKYSARLYPEIDEADNSCLMIRRQVIQQSGAFRKDYCKQAKKNGWKIALADNVYVYFSKPEHYIEQNQFIKGKELSPSPTGKSDQPEGWMLSNKPEYRILTGISAYNQHLHEREDLLQQGRINFSNRRVLFVLPVIAVGGGANLVFLIVQAMRKMGVDAQIMNLNIYHPTFEKAYPDVDVPLFYGEITEIPQIACKYDAVVATSNTSVSWIARALDKCPNLLVGYYIQDYEPYFYPPETEGYHEAVASYTLIPNIVRCVTTQWISDELQRYHQISCHIIGGHLDVDLFRPRHRPETGSTKNILRIVAMIRPTSERRNPRLTMEILQQTSDFYGSKVEIMLFGCEPDDPGFLRLARNFSWNLAGELRTTQVANLLNNADIFVDFSIYQALGLTALESMACGLATITPMYGGTGTFAHNEENSLVIDTHDPKICLRALRRLIEDDALRVMLQSNAIYTAVQFYPERPTYNMLKAIFSTPS